MVINLDGSENITSSKYQTSKMPSQQSKLSDRKSRLSINTKTRSHPSRNIFDIRSPLTSINSSNKLKLGFKPSDESVFDPKTERSPRAVKQTIVETEAEEYLSGKKDVVNAVPLGYGRNCYICK